MDPFSPSYSDDKNRVPIRTGKPGKWEGDFQSWNFEQTEKVREFQTNVIYYFW